MAGDRVRFTVRVVPRAGRDGIEGVDGSGALRVRVRAAPVDGEANSALRRLLAQEVGVAAGQVSIVIGATARRKVVEIDGVAAGVVAARYPGLTL